MSSDKALDSYKEKGIHWNLNLTKCIGIGKSLLYQMTFTVYWSKHISSIDFTKKKGGIGLFLQGRVMLENFKFREKSIDDLLRPKLRLQAADWAQSTCCTKIFLPC